MHNERSH